MRIQLIQSSPVWENPSQSLAELETILSSSPEADLVVLPEMFATGFVTKPGAVSEVSGREGLDWMRDYAVRNGRAVAGSLSTTSPEGFRNRFYFVFPDGAVSYYDKRHLFTYSGEHERYVPGKERVIVEYMGVRILLQVCYDLRFPAFARNRLVDGRPEYDLILYVASWPESRIAAWDALLKARAIENACYVAGVNRVGSDPKNIYPGHTTLINPLGEVLSICKQNAVDSIICEVSMEFLDAYRQGFPVLADAD